MKKKIKIVQRGKDKVEESMGQQLKPKGIEEQWVISGKYEKVVNPKTKITN